MLWVIKSISEYPQCMFWSRDKKILFYKTFLSKGLDKASACGILRFTKE